MNEIIGCYILISAFGFPVVLFLYFDVCRLYKKVNEAFCIMRDAYEAQKSYSTHVKKTSDSLKDELTQIKHIDHPKLCEIWTKYKEFLMEKYPAEEGKDWEFTCEYHKKIEKILNDT